MSRRFIIWYHSFFFLWTSLYCISIRKRCHLAGVIYCLHNHLYSSNLECVFTVWVWTKEQTSVHSSSVIFSVRSILQACRILSEDSLHLLTNISYNMITCPPFSRCFKMMSSSVDKGGSSKLLPCLDIMKLRNGRFLKKCFVGILYVVLSSSNDMNLRSREI